MFFDLYVTNTSLYRADDSTRNLVIGGVAQINFGYTNASSHAPLDALRGFFDAGALRAHVFETFPFERAAEAYALSKAGEVVGKVAVVPAGAAARAIRRRG